MGIETWHIWIIIAILLFIVEIFAPTFLAACLGIGCISAAIFTYFDFGFKIQLIAFSIGTLVSFFGIRPFMLKYALHRKNDVKTNVDAIIGKIGTVTEEVDNSKNHGRIAVYGDDWRAESEDDEIIKVGEKAKVLKINSTILIVKRLNNKEI